MAATGLRARHAWAAVLTGLVWAQGCIAIRLILLPPHLAPGELITDGGWYRVASWTLLAPATAATRLASGHFVLASQAPEAGLSLIALILCPVIAVALCLLIAWVSCVGTWRRWAGYGFALVVVLGVASGTVVALQFRDAAFAESAFFAMVSHVDAPHRDAATVSAAREFAERHSGSRWAGEALRIVAMAEWDSGHAETASETWRRFESRFRDRRAPGVAYAHYNLALCDERLRRDPAAGDHLRRAIDVIRSRRDGIQGWIATDAAAKLSALERSAGRYGLACYWNAKSQTFANVYSTD